MAEHPIKREFDEAYGLVEGKATDYAEDDNVFSNFEFAAEAAGITVEQVFLTMMGIKQARLVQLIANEKQPNYESIDDTLLDSMNYPGLLKAYRRSVRPDTIQDIFDGFARDELGDKSLEGFAFNKGGLIDAVMNDPTSGIIEDFTSCGDENCCGLEDDYEGSDSDFLSAQVDDGLDYTTAREGTEWREGDEFLLTDQRIYTGYGENKQVQEIIPSAGPYTIEAIGNSGVLFMYGDRRINAAWNEIEPVRWTPTNEPEWEPGDRFILLDDRIFPNWKRETPTDRVMSSIGPYEVIYTSVNPDGDAQVHFKGVEFEDRQPLGGTWFARYTEIEGI
jgi:hypothetical protein